LHALAGLVLVTALATACGTTPPPGTVAPTAGTSEVAPSGGSAGRIATAAPPATAAPTVSRAAVLLDPALLRVLPAEVDGHPVEESVEVEEANVAAPAMPAEIRSLAAAFVHDDGMTNWAVATVVLLHAGVLGDAFHRSWRDSFDTGACEPAGGVTGTASTTIGGRPVDIGRCAGGVHTYHARLSGDRLVSVTAVGDLRFGELLMAGLVE